jgi:hypothetical protein
LKIDYIVKKMMDMLMVMELLAMSAHFAEMPRPESNGAVGADHVPVRRDGSFPALQRLGAAAWDVGPPTPFWWPNASSGLPENGSMMVFESIRFCGRGDQAAVWPPGSNSGVDPASNASYFRIRTLVDGDVVSVVSGSEGYAYGSAVVDPIAGRAWVFGSHSDLCGDRVHRDNGIRAWWSSDLTTWHTAAQPALVTPEKFPFNTRATLVTAPIPGLPNVDFVMAVENGRLAVHDAGTANRNLSIGWRMLNWTADGGFSACPASLFFSSSVSLVFLIFLSFSFSPKRGCSFRFDACTLNHAQQVVL